MASLAGISGLLIHVNAANREILLIIQVSTKQEDIK
jgi:hypothetical protein